MDPKVVTTFPFPVVDFEQVAQEIVGPVEALKSQVEDLTGQADASAGEAAASAGAAATSKDGARDSEISAANLARAPEDTPVIFQVSDDPPSFLSDFSARHYAAKAQQAAESVGNPLPRNGSAAMESDLPMGGNKITDLADGEEADDAATVGQTLGNPFAMQPLAVPFGVWDHIPGAPIPNNSGTAKFIRLTAAQSGVGGYNEGLLTDEQVSGSAPLVEADAEIMVGPMAGQRVPLINTEMSFIRPGTDSGALQFDQMQRITGSFKGGRAGGEEGVGAFSVLSYQSNNISGSNSSTFYSFNSADSPDARASDTTDGETRPKNRQATFYMRIA